MATCVSNAVWTGCVVRKRLEKRHHNGQVDEANRYGHGHV